MNAPQNITLLEGLSNGCFFIGRDLRISYLNKKAAELLGVNAGNEDRIQLSTLFPAGEETWFFASLNKAFETGRHLTAAGLHSQQNRWLQADVYPSPEGALVLLRDDIPLEIESVWNEPPTADASSHKHDSGYVLRDEAKPYPVISYRQHVTNSVAAGQALPESEERYSDLFERTSDCIVVYDRNLNIVDVNFATADFSGYSKQELKTMRITDFLSQEELAEQPLSFDRIRAGETAVNRRRIKAKSGAFRVMDINSKMLPGGNVMALLRNVTSRTEAERELSNSEVRFRTLAENLPVGVFETDEAGNTTYVNSKMLDYTGLSFNEMMGTAWVHCIHPSDCEGLLRQWQENLAARRKSSLQYRIVSVAGTLRWVKGKAVPVFDKFGQFKGYQGTVIDITKEKEAMEAVAASEEKYRTLVEEAPDAIYIVDEEGRFITVNSSAGKITGYSRQEMLRMNVTDFLLAGDLLKNPLRNQELREGKRVSVERRVKTKNGGLLYAEFNAKMLSDGRILVFARDATERVTAQKEVIREKNFSDDIINSLPGIFYLTDTDGNVLRWNKNFETVSGYSGGEIANMKGWDFFDDEGRKLLKQKTDEVFARGKSEMETYFFTKGQQRIPYYFNGWKVIFGSRICLIGVGIDITEKGKAAELLRQSYDDIRRLAAHQTRVRDDERRRIAREIHDELGQQLTAVKMDVSWIDKRLTAADETVKTKLKNIIGLLDSGNGSVRRILTELNTGIVGADGLLDALERQNRLFTSSTGVPVAFYTPEHNLKLSQEAAACIFRVYQESLTNIMRYAKAKTVTASLQVVDAAVHVSIEDNGKGFNTRKLFGKNSFGILGMRERVLSQGGNFQVKSQRGRGTKVSFSVPVNTEIVSA